MTRIKKEYYWEQQPEGYYLDEKIDWIKKNKHWNEVRNLYIDLKNNNNNRDKKSRSLRAEAINNIYNEYNINNCKKKNYVVSEHNNNKVYNGYLGLTTKNILIK